MELMAENSAPAKMKFFKKNSTSTRKPWNSYLHEFGEYTSLHGLKYVILPSLHYINTITWIIALTATSAGATDLILTSWQRFNANPTVISLDKEFRKWNINFPSATVCFLDPLNLTLAHQYITESWSNVDSTISYDFRLRFLSTITNLTYDNLDDFKQFIGVESFENMPGEELSRIAQKLKLKLTFHSNIYNESFESLTFRETLTEMGICYTYAGVVANYVNIRREAAPNHLMLPKCNYLNSLCYARVEDFPAPIKYYIHSPHELPDTSDKYHIVLLNMERDTSFRSKETVSAPELRRLEARQRDCRFIDEPMGYYQVYSYKLCRMSCRRSIAITLCGCSPFFYMKVDNWPLCNVKGLVCLSKFKNQIKKLIYTDGRRMPCKCVTECDSTVFLLDKNNARKWTYPVPRNVRFRWAIEQYSKTRYKRNIIFGFEDLLVSLGGVVALFLGCSVLSFVELFYFFTLRLFWYWFKQRN